MNKPKLIMLYGLASSGKSTLAKMYINEHALSTVIEGDKLMDRIERWRENEPKAREDVFKQIKSIAIEKLKTGHSVVLPCLLTDDSHAKTFEEIAINNSADFYEIYINLEKEDAINRLLGRGVWGEENSPKLNKENLPEINNLFKTMSFAMDKRKNVKSLRSSFGDIEGAYQKLLKIVHG